MMETAMPGTSKTFMVRSTKLSIPLEVITWAWEDKTPGIKKNKRIKRIR
jgi:hypothetical protein